MTTLDILMKISSWRFWAKKPQNRLKMRYFKCYEKLMFRTLLIFCMKLQQQKVLNWFKLFFVQKCCFEFQDLKGTQNKVFGVLSKFNAWDFSGFVSMNLQSLIELNLTYIIFLGNVSYWRFWSERSPKWV